MADAPDTGLTGSPPVTHFAPDIDTYPQNFDLAEDGASILYLANNDGVLVFDGSRWQLVRMPNHELVRSLAFDGHSRIYVGGYDVLGYLERDAGGQAVFHDLTPRFKALTPHEHFADIWSIRITGNGVFFGALHHLFEYDPATGATHLWRNSGRYGAMGVLDGNIVVQFRGEGLKRLHAGQWQALPGASVSHFVHQIEALPNGGLLLFGPDGHWGLYRDGKLSDYKMPPGFPPATHFSGARMLTDGTLALSSVDGYLYFIAADGLAVRRVRLGNGYLSGLIEDDQGGLLVSDDTGIYHVSWPSSWTSLGPESGFSSPLALSHWRGRWQVLTSAGAFESDAAADAGPGMRFHATDWTANEAWDLLPLDAHNALLAESYSVELVHDGNAHPITHRHLYPRFLWRSRFDPDTVYIGTEMGISSLHHDPSGWHLQLDDEHMGDPSITSLVEIAPGRLWAGSERGGVHLLQLRADGKRVLGDQRMSLAQGLDYGGRVADAGVTRLPDGQVIAATAAGEFRWQDGRFVRDDLGGLERLRSQDERVTLKVVGNTLWAFGYRHIYRRDPQTLHWQAEPIGGLLKGALQTVYADATGNLDFVASGSILSYRQVVDSKPPPAPQVMLQDVKLTDANGKFRYLPLDQPLRLPEGGQSLKFEFALPDHAAQQRVRFKAALLGFETMSDTWDRTTKYTYSHLRPITYRFELLGRDGSGHVTHIRPFLVEVVPRWYARTWVTVVWLALLLLVALMLVWWLIRRRTHMLQLDTLRLAGMVSERTLELETANRRLDAMAHLDGLTGIPNRRRLDSYLELAWTQANERRRSIAVLAIDVDHFKLYNDEHGHLAGDNLLKNLAQELSRCLRRTEDFVARSGGEEFLAILPGADGKTAHAVAESMRTRIEHAQLGSTISLGVASCIPEPGSLASSLVNAADAALYQAKADGRNRTRTATDGG